MADRDYYEVLGVPRDASADQIKKAYRGLARKHHPDANPGEKTSEAKFKEVQNAYDILSDPEKKARFDQFGSAAFEGFGPAGPRSGASEWAARQAGGGGFDDVDLSAFFGPRVGGGPGFGGGDEDVGGGGIFDEIITRMRGGDRGGRRRQTSHSPEAAEASLSIPFLTAVRGGETTVELEREPGRRETKVVKIPSGLESGAKIRLKGQGDSSGQLDLIITVTVEPHPYFTREGRNLSVEVPVSVPEAILGAKIEVPTLDGLKTMTIPAGTSSGPEAQASRARGSRPRRTIPTATSTSSPRWSSPGRSTRKVGGSSSSSRTVNPSRPREGLW